MPIRRTEKTLRNLGRVVGYKATETGSDIEKQYKDKGYIVEKEGDKFLRIYKPAITYDKEKKKGSSGWEKLKASYIPHEFIFDEQGNLIKELKRDTVQTFHRFEDSQTETWEPYIEEEKTYTPSGYLKSEKYYDDYMRLSSSGSTERGYAKLKEQKNYDDEGYLKSSRDIIYNKYGQRVEQIDKDYVSGEVKEKGYSPIITSGTQRGIKPIEKQAGEDTLDYMKRKAAEEAARRKLIQQGTSVSDINKAFTSGTSAVQLKNSFDSIKTPAQLSKLYSGTETLRQGTLSPIQVEAAVKAGVLTKRDLTYTGIKKESNFKIGTQSDSVQVTGGGAGLGPKLKPLSATKELLPGKTIQMKTTTPPTKDFSSITGMGVLDSSKNVWSKIFGKTTKQKDVLDTSNPSSPFYSGPVYSKINYLPGTEVAGPLSLDSLSKIYIGTENIANVKSLNPEQIQIAVDKGFLVLRPEFRKSVKYQYNPKTETTDFIPQKVVDRKTHKISPTGNIEKYPEGYIPYDSRDVVKSSERYMPSGRDDVVSVAVLKEQYMGVPLVIPMLKGRTELTYDEINEYRDKGILKSRPENDGDYKYNPNLIYDKELDYVYEKKVDTKKYPTGYVSQKELGKQVALKYGGSPEFGDKVPVDWLKANYMGTPLIKEKFLSYDQINEYTDKGILKSRPENDGDYKYDEDLLYDSKKDTFYKKGTGELKTETGTIAPPVLGQQKTKVTNENLNQFITENITGNVSVKSGKTTSRKILAATREQLKGKTISMNLNDSSSFKTPITNTEAVGMGAITGMGIADGPKSVWNKIYNNDFIRGLTGRERKIVDEEVVFVPKFIEGLAATRTEAVRVPRSGEFTFRQTMVGKNPRQTQDYLFKYEDSKLISMAPAGEGNLLWEGERKQYQSKWEQELDRSVKYNQPASFNAITGSTILERPLEIEKPTGSILTGPMSVKGPEIKALPPGLMPPSPLDLVYPQLGTTIEPVAEKIQEVSKPKVEMFEERGVMDTSVPKSEWYKTSPENLELSRRMAEANLAMLKIKENSLLGTDSKELKKIQAQREKLQLEISLLYPKEDAKKILEDTKGKSIKEISQTLQELGKYEGRIIPIVEKGAAEREIPHELRTQDLETRGAELEKKYALVLLENENLNAEVNKYNDWITSKTKQEEELYKNTDVTNKQQVNIYNAFVKEYEKENKEKVAVLEKQQRAFSNKYGDYTSAENKVLSDYKEYKKEVEAYNEEVRKRNKEREIDETLLEKANIEFKNKYYEDKTYYPTADIGGTTVQPTVVSQLKEMKGDYMPAGVFKDKPYTSEYEKDLENLNKLNEAFNQKYFPVKPIQVGNIEDIYKYVMKTGIPNVDTSVAFKTKNAIESGQLKVVVKARDKLKPGEIHADDVRQIIQESGVPLRQNLERDTTYEQLKNIPTMPFQKRKTDDAAIQFLQDKITSAEEIKTGKRIATGTAYAVATAALPGVLQAAAGLKTKSLLLKPGAKAISWTAKALLSKPGQIAMGTLYTGSVGMRGYEGIKEKDIDKLIDLGVEVGGIGTGMAWYSGTGGHPFKQTFKTPWTATQVAAYGAKGQPYGRAWRPEASGTDKFSATALGYKTVRGISTTPALAKPVKGGTITYDPVSPRQFEPHVRVYDTATSKFKYQRVTPEESFNLEKQGYDISLRPVDTQLTFAGKSKTPEFADFISIEGKGPIKGLELIKPPSKVSTATQAEFKTTPSTQRSFLENKLYAKSKALGVVEVREIKLTPEGVFTKNPRTGQFEVFDSKVYELNTITEGQFGYERPLTVLEKAAIYKSTKPSDASVEETLLKYQQQSPSTTQELFKLEGLEVVDVKPDGSLLVKGRQPTGSREIVLEEISARDPRNTKVIDELLVRASQPYKSEIETLAEKIQLDSVIQKTQAKRLAKEESSAKFKESREKARAQEKTFAEQPTGGRQITEMERLQKYKESYPGEQLQRAIVEADPYGMSGSRYTKYQQEPQYKKVTVGPRTDFVGLKPAGQKFMELTYIAEPIELGKIFYDQKPMYKYRQELRGGLELEQKEKLDSILIPKTSTYRALDYVQKEYIQQDSGQEQRGGQEQIQEPIVIPDLIVPEIPPELVPGQIGGRGIRPIKLPPFMPFIGGGGFFPQASGGYGSGRAVKSWTVTNPLKNIQQQFKIRQKIKTMQELERKRKKALPQEAANRAFKPIRKLDVNQIKNIMGSK